VKELFVLPLAGEPLGKRLERLFSFGKTATLTVSPAGSSPAPSPASGGGVAAQLVDEAERLGVLAGPDAPFAISRTRSFGSFRPSATFDVKSS